MGYWEEVNADASHATLQRCAELYVAAHNGADRPQTKFDPSRLQTLLDPVVFNRHKVGVEVRPVLKLYAWKNDQGVIQIALFLNKTIKRLPPHKTTFEGAKVTRSWWNLSIGSEATEIKDIYPEPVREECIEISNSLEDAKEELRFLVVKPNGTIFDKLIEKISNDKKYFTVSNKVVQVAHNPWKYWQDANGKITFERIKAK